MKYVMKLEGLARGGETPYDGTYLKVFDFVDCEPGEAHIDTVDDPAQAKHFADLEELRAEWLKPDPRAPWERPLSAFSFSVESVP